MKNKLLTLVLVIGLTNPVWAATTFGRKDCGQWVREQHLPLPSLVNKAWLVGFLSGLNQDPYYKNALDKASSTEQIYLWMDNYCKTNPLETLATGSFRLMNELMSKQ